MYKWLGISICVILCACENHKKILDSECSNVEKTDVMLAKYRQSKHYSDSLSVNTAALEIDYSRSGYYLIDKQKGWEKHFSDKYFDIKVQYFDSVFILLYANISGIKNGLTLFPKKNNSLFLLKRESGTKQLEIESRNGIEYSFILENNIYFRLYDSKSLSVYPAINN